MPYVARTKTAKKKLQGHAGPPPIRTVTLACGCTTDLPPKVSNPDRWWCCGAYQAKTRGRTPRTPMVGNAHKRHGAAA